MPFLSVLKGWSSAAQAAVVAARLQVGSRAEVHAACMVAAPSGVNVLNSGLKQGVMYSHPRQSWHFFGCSKRSF